MRNWLSSDTGKNSVPILGSRASEAAKSSRMPVMKRRRWAKTQRSDSS